MIALLLKLRVVLNYSPTRLALLGSIFPTERSILLHSKVGILPETAACNRHYEFFFRSSSFFSISSFWYCVVEAEEKLVQRSARFVYLFFFLHTTRSCLIIFLCPVSLTKSCPITFMCISAHLSLPTQRMLRKIGTL